MALVQWHSVVQLFFVYYLGTQEGKCLVDPRILNVIPIHALSYMVTPLPVTCECGFSTIEISQAASMVDKHITFPTKISIINGISGHTVLSSS
jgi:hypothetical protein